MGAIMAIAEVFGCLLHLSYMLCNGNGMLRLLTCHHLFGASEKTIFTPLRAATCLPTLSTDIAELSTTETAGVDTSEQRFSPVDREQRTSCDYIPRSIPLFAYNCDSVAIPALRQLRVVVA